MINQSVSTALDGSFLAAQSSELNDQSLLEGCIANNRVAQATLFEKYKRKVVGICRRYAKSKMEADDFAQETFIRVFKSLHSTRNDQIKSLDAWITTITIRTSIDLLRKAKIDTVPIDDLDGHHAPFVDNLALDQLNAESLINLIEQMPVGFKIVFNLYVVEGYTHTEIGELLSIEESTSRSQLTRAKHWLYERLKQSKNATT